MSYRVEVPQKLAHRFQQAGKNSYKWECILCGATGYPSDPDEWSRSWVATHLRDHDPCEGGCGKLLVQYENGRQRTHLRCPGPPEPADKKKSKKKKR